MALLDKAEPEYNFIEEYVQDLPIPVANDHGEVNFNNLLYDDESGLSF